jgi:hypothetical protein
MSAYFTTMRLTSEFWVAALIRRAFSAGDFATVLSKGSPEAGAVHILVRDRLGNVSLYRPAPQSSYDDAKPSDRLFQFAGQMQWDEIESWLEKERRFDPDIWIVELELKDHDAIQQMIAISG